MQANHRAILDSLDKHHAPAAAFVIEERVHSMERRKGRRSFEAGSATVMTWATILSPIGI